MFDHARFSGLLSERRNIHSGSADEMENYYDKMSRFIAEDLDNSIDFIENQCTAEEFVWLSEVFEEIAQKTQSRVFIQCLEQTVLKFPKESELYNLRFFIQDAESFIE